MSYKPIKNEIYHVHTFRCGHATDEKDIEYVRKAIELKASRIVFTDHAPFPDNRFKNRMKMEQLPEYISTIQALKEQFSNEIEILCGLEVEWLPSYEEHLHKLRNMKEIDVMMLGQHFCEYPNGEFSVFNPDKSHEYIDQSLATRDGIRTGLFDVVAHPDRVFRVREQFGPKEEQLSKEMISAAFDNGNWNGVYFEWNYSSFITGQYLRKEFWQLIPDRRYVIKGLDAHSVKEMEDGYNAVHNE